MSIRAKYFGDQDRRYGAHLTWPGTSAGYPIRGHVSPMMKSEEFEDLEHACEFKCRMFRTWEGDDLREYQWVMDRVINQFFVLRTNERQWCPEQRGYFIWLEWAEVYGVAPDGEDRDPIGQLVEQARAKPDGKAAIVAITGRNGHAG